MKLYYKMIVLACVVPLAIAGCATQGPYFKLDASVQREIRQFGSQPYIPLIRLCDAYGLECDWDSFTRTAIVKKGSQQIVLRSDSRWALVDGRVKNIGRPVVYSEGALYLPLVFVESELGPFIGRGPTSGAREEAIAPSRFSIRTVILDAGHGGYDAGAIGGRLGLKEKEMTLKLACKVKQILEQNGLKVMMTRREDIFVPLPQRAKIANRSGADLFVSIHINASRARSMRGFECYFLSNATDDNARALEAYKTSSLNLGDTAHVLHSRQLDKTLWDMTLTEDRIEASEIAKDICDSVEESLAIRNRGIRTARFYVLKRTNMPAVLVEAGYISNRYEELKIKDPVFLDRIAEAVAKGVLRFKREYEKTDAFTRT